MVDVVTGPDLHEKLMDFLSVDHFMVPREQIEQFNAENDTKAVMCEQCGQVS